MWRLEADFEGEIETFLKTIDFRMDAMYLQRWVQMSKNVTVTKMRAKYRRVSLKQPKINVK